MVDSASLTSDSVEKQEYLKTIKASKISIKDGKLNVGLVVNASDTFMGAAGHAVEGDGPNVVHVPGFLKGHVTNLQPIRTSHFLLTLNAHLTINQRLKDKMIISQFRIL